MPEGTLKFNLEDSYEQELFKDAVKAQAYKACLLDISEWLRKRIKYEDHPEEVYEMLEKTRDVFYQILEDNEIIL